MHMAAETKQWTLEELHSLPDDGNKYELIDGELFVTPAPGEDHETILARLTRVLDPCVAANGLGIIFHPRAVFRRRGSEVEPDLMVRQPRTVRLKDWDDAPLPSLVVEVISPWTRRREHEHKRRFYMNNGVAEYWIVDPDRREIVVVRPDQPDEVETTRLRWSPAGAANTLDVGFDQIFGPEL